MPNTPVFGWPYQALTDAPDGAALGEDLALAIEATFVARLPNQPNQQSYTPSLLASTTNPTLGTGSVASGIYWVDPLSNRVWGSGLIRFGTSGTAAGSGNYFITLPTAVDSIGLTLDLAGIAPILGLAAFRDNSAAGSSRSGQLALRSETGGPNGVGLANLMVYTGSAAQATESTPWGWTTQDGISFFFDYMSPVS